MACTGIEYCKLAIVETKARAATDGGRSSRSGSRRFDAPLTIHVNGCPNSCARIQTADLGFKGQIVTTEDGRPGRGLPGARRGWPRARLRVRSQAARPQGDSDDLPDYVERVVRAYDEGREADETFARWAARADEEVLR